MIVKQRFGINNKKRQATFSTNYLNMETFQTHAILKHAYRYEYLPIPPISML